MSLLDRLEAALHDERLRLFRITPTNVPHGVGELPRGTLYGAAETRWRLFPFHGHLIDGIYERTPGALGHKMRDMDEERILTSLPRFHQRFDDRRIDRLTGGELERFWAAYRSFDQRQYL